MGDTQVGWRHFAAAEWAEARDSFAAVLTEAPGDPDALDGLGQSLWWLGERDAGIDSRREAYAAFRRRGDLCAARALPCTWRASTGSTAAAPARPAGSRGRAACSTEQGRSASSAGCASRRRSAPDDPAVAERFAREALGVAHELATPTSSAWRSRSWAAPSSAGKGRGGRRLPRRGDDRRARRRDERPARMRRRVLHDARRLRWSRRPRAGRGMVRGGRRLRRAPPLHPAAVVVSRDLRRVLVRSGEWARAEQC